MVMSSRSASISHSSPAMMSSTTAWASLSAPIFSTTGTFLPTGIFRQAAFAAGTQVPLAAVMITGLSLPTSSVRSSG